MRIKDIEYGVSWSFDSINEMLVAGIDLYSLSKYFE